LDRPIPAGTWHLVGDVEVVAAGDVRYDFIWRHAGTDTTLVTFDHHFEMPASFMATQYDADATGIAAAAKAGDELVWRWTITGATPGAMIIPNGDGPLYGGRYPSIRTPR
jgi:hypothetical protein